MSMGLLSGVHSQINHFLSYVISQSLSGLFAQVLTCLGVLGLGQSLHERLASDKDHSFGVYRDDAQIEKEISKCRQGLQLSQTISQTMQSAGRRLETICGY